MSKELSNEELLKKLLQRQSEVVLRGQYSQELLGEIRSLTQEVLKRMDK